MLKSRFCSLAIVCMIGLYSFNPVTTFAAEVESEAKLLSENDRDQDRKAAFEEKMIAATEKWKTLSNKQKDQVYHLIEKEMHAKFKVMDQMVELGIIVKEDVDLLKSHMKEKFNEMKESGELPMPKYRVKKQQ